MALVLADRVLETTTTAGSGTITLAGAEPGYQSFSAVGDGNQTYYTITADVDWEVGIGTYTASGTTLSRDTVLSSSNSGAKVTFSAGVKKVFVTYPSEKSVNRDVSGNISAASGVITNVGYPSAASDAATKLYVDSLAEFGITYHAPVKYEVPNSTGNLVATYNNGTAGVSATLTNAGSLVPFIPDGVTASISDRVLVYSQTNGFENGVYTVTVVGDGSTAWVLTRASDADTYALKSPNSLGGGDAFFVTSGDTGAGETYICNNSGVISFGSTAISFVQISSAQVYKAGTGISLTNTTISLVSPVAVATGGTGTTGTPNNGELLIGNGSGYTLATLTAGSGVSITNSAGSITLSATGLGGTVTAVTATGPLASSGGTTPDISIANSTGTGSVVLDQGATISSATITAALSASITTITGSSANITTVTGTTTTFSSGTISQLGATSATVTTLSGTNVTYSSGTVSQLAATSATIATVSGTNATYSNGNFTSATVTTVSGTTATYTSATVTNLNVTSVTLSNLSIASANITTLTGTNLTYTSGTVTNLNSTSANITTLTGTTFGTTATTQLRGASAQITTLTGTTATFTNLTVSNTANASISGNAATATTATNVSSGGQINAASATITTITSTSANITTLTGTTFGTTATTQLRANSLAISTTGARWDSAGDIYAIRSGGTTGVIFLGNSGLRYLFYDGSQYYLNGANLSINGVQAVTNSGTWNITSNYANNLTQGFNSNWNTDFAAAPAGSTILRGDTSTGSSTGGPGGTWWFQQNMRHTNASNVWGVQVAWGWEDNANILRTRNVQGGTYGSWVTYLNSANASSYVAVLPTVNVTSSTSIAATTGNHYILRGGATTVTLPASPSAGNIVWVTVSNGRSDNVIARNGQNIQGLAENMTLDAPYAAVQLRFSDATMGWVFC